MNQVIHQIGGLPVTLDALWVEGERLGDVSVETNILSSRGRYTATIRLQVGASVIYARGHGDDQVTALGRAIVEARRFQQ